MPESIAPCEPLPPYTVQAFNNAASMENKIHDDAVASQYGFKGALVPGAAVFGYMAHQPVALWGREWLEHGKADCRFSQPVYDGVPVSVTAAPLDDGLAIEVRSQGQSCARGTAALHEAGAAPVVDHYRFATPPESALRPLADQQSLAQGTILCTRPLDTTAALSNQWLDEVRETDILYRSAGLVHPTMLLRLCNWALMQNVLLGPWIHTGSRVQHFNAMPVGASLAARGVVLRNYEHKGHQIVDVDVLVVIDGKTPAARITHTAIYQPRPPDHQR